MNHILDVAGLKLGHVTDQAHRTGVTTVVFDEPAVVGVAVHGGAPGSRETDALDPSRLAPGVDAVCLSGGSAFGLGSADGVARALAARGRGFQVREHHVPIVPAAVVFDLIGSDPDNRPDFRALGEASVAAAFAAPDTALGTVGAGCNATTATLKGGFGSASAKVGAATVAAIVIANPYGSVVGAEGPWFRAAPFEVADEFGGRGNAPSEADLAAVLTKGNVTERQNTTIALIATDMALTGAEAHRVAVAAHDGIALAIFPAHTMFDGDTVFAASTARAAAPASPLDLIDLHVAATRCLARAICRAVFAARAVPGDAVPTWQDRFGASA